MSPAPKLRTILVDDEELARERLAGLLKREPDVDLVAECSDGLDAVDTIRRLAPDLVFLDVQMPELDGFGVIEALGRHVPPAVIFVTAYDKYALKAFEIHAVDYLLKPFDRERLQTALDRARHLIHRRDAEDLERRLSGLLQDLRGGGRLPDRLALKHEGRVTFLRTEDIDWVEAADNYVHLHVGSEVHTLRETMTALEGRLSARRFLRINRSTIVNIDRIRELQPLFHGEYAVILRNATRLTLSRGYRDKLDLLMGKGA